MTYPPRTFHHLITPTALVVIVLVSVLRTTGLRAQQPAPTAPSSPYQGIAPKSSGPTSAQGAAEEKPRSGWAALPILSYTPETELGLGGFGAHFFRFGNDPASSRPSSLALVGLYTTRDQVILEFIPELYWSMEQWHIWSKIDYRLYPNSYWGVGNNTPDSAKENYTENTPRLQFWLRRKIYASFYVEGRVDAQYLVVQDVSEEGLLANKSVLGARGGRTVGVGLTVGWDARDHAIQPHRGGFYELSSMGWQGVIGSEYDFAELTLNLRQYIPVTETHVLALQLYGQFLSGAVPFYKLAMVGGQRLLRGYYEGRYRDKELLAAQAEYRFPIFWRFGAVAFVAAGDVSNRLANFSLNHVKWTVGGGLRLLLNDDERLNLRVDFAFNLHTFGPYVNVAESF